jgi:hypothetical protein
MQVDFNEPVKSHIHSQSFFSDFINFLDNLAKNKVRSVNQTIFPQILQDIVKLISVEYNEQFQAYPINFTAQMSACKLLKNALRSQQSFDDTAILARLVQKLRHEIDIIAKQSQSQHVEKDPRKKGYLFIYDQSWPNDDDYLSRYQNLQQRHIIVKYLLNILQFCITRNDQNLVSYNQNFVAHTRKILESSLIQDDFVTKVFKIHETQPPTVAAGGKDENQVQETISPLVLSCIQLVT